MSDILMPALSPTMTEGKLARWLKKPGDAIAPGDVIAEIETDKAMMEVEAIDEGTLGEIKVPEGTEGVAVNAVIATMIGGDEKAGAQRRRPPRAGSFSRGSAEGRLSQPSRRPRPLGVPAPQAGRQRSRTRHPHHRHAAGAPSCQAGRHRPLRHQGQRPPWPHRQGRPGQRAEIRCSVRPPAAPLTKGQDAKQLADLLGMKYEARPNSSFRKTIARRLTEAKQTVPHFYLTLDCRIDALLDLRKKLNASAGEGGKVSVNDFVIRASALALRKIPDANVSWSDDAILAYQDVDISVAVATPNGLITPIIKQADTKSLRQIAGEMRDLAARARDGKLKPQEYQGGTFSISNLGMYGIREFAAVINPPQSCILAVGNGEQRAVVEDGELKIATLMTCTLSVDHRAVDGALGAEYLGAFKALMEDPYSLLL